MVGNELGVGLHQFMDNAKPVGLDGASGFGDLHNGIGQTGNHLGFGGAPGKLHLDTSMLNFRNTVW